MKIDLSQFREVFLQESAEHVASMETGLFQLRSTPDDIELLNAIFRSAHSIKGGAGSFGLNNLVRFTHALENLLEQLRSLELAAGEEVVDVLLESVDLLRGLLEAGPGDDMPAEASALMLRVEAFGHHAPAAGAMKASVTIAATLAQRFKVEFRPHPDIFASGCNPLLLLRNLAEVGTVDSCLMDTSRLPKLAELNPEQCCVGWTVELSSERGEADILEVFEFVDHLAHVSVAFLGVEPKVQAAPELPSAAATVAKKRPATAESNSIRVSTEKVDRLIDLVGELVIAHVMTEQIVEKFTPDCLPLLREAVAAMERNTKELHERVMAIRMLPVGSLFQRYTRTVYDIAKSSGKEMALELSGEETEIDKSMLELLGDPLIHLIRNAADHGIESPERRVAAGKPAEGRIHLSACHRAGRILIEIADDGAGVDPVRVRAKAIERGLITATAQLTDQQLKMLVFEPGFSTRDEVSDLSGRGVGMDVVKRNIQQLNGSVSLSSEVGRGSTVTIELPLTLAIMQGLLVRVQDRTLVVPLLVVVETISPDNKQIVRIAEQGEALMIRGESVPLLRLSNFLNLPVRVTVTHERRRKPRPADERSLVVVVDAGGSKIGLIVDELMGQQQVVLKSLERHLHKIEGLMGATILGDGCVAPILDVIGIANLNLYAHEYPEATLLSA
jgi:two-component system chemotaxis sensor kinase CheA